MKKQFLIYGLALIFLVACDSGSSGNSSKIADDSTKVGDSATNSNPNLPPDPGEAGKLTIAGIDSDNDGVRDDVQIAIYNRHPDAPEKRAALEQQAKAFQKALIAGESGDTDEAFKIFKEMSIASQCIFTKNGGIQNPQAREEARSIDMKILNTNERYISYSKYAQQLDGNFFGDNSVENPCDN